MSDIEINGAKDKRIAELQESNKVLVEVVRDAAKKMISHRLMDKYLAIANEQEMKDE